MLFLIKRIILVTIFTIFSFHASAEDKFCIEGDGFIYPIFDQENCNEKSDEKITKSEFINIINFEKNLRKAKLEEFRNSDENLEIKTEKDVELADVEKIKTDLLQKIKENKKTKENCKINERKNFKQKRNRKD